MKCKVKKIITLLLAFTLIVGSFQVTAVEAQRQKAPISIYVDGKEGDDSRNGLVRLEAVKTYEKAAKMVEPGGVVYICNTIILENDETWNVPVERSTGFLGTLVETTATLTLDGITMNREDIKGNVQVENEGVLLKKNELSILCEDILQGETLNIQVVTNENQGVITYQYKKQGEEEYSTEPPVDPGKYLLIASTPSGNGYSFTQIEVPFTILSREQEEITQEPTTGEGTSEEDTTTEDTTTGNITTGDTTTEDTTTEDITKEDTTTGNITTGDTTTEDTTTGNITTGDTTTEDITTEDTTEDDTNSGGIVEGELAEENTPEVEKPNLDAPVEESPIADVPKEELPTDSPTEETTENELIIAQPTVPKEETVGSNITSQDKYENAKELMDEFTNRIMGLPNEVSTVQQVEEILAITKEYDTLQSQYRKLLSIETLEYLKKVQDSAKNFNRTSNGVVVTGDFPWYIQFQASLQNNTTSYEKPEVDKILAPYDLKLWNLYTNEEYKLELGKKVLISMPAPNVEGYENFVIVHYLENGALEYITPLVTNGRMTFETSTFSPFDIAGSTILIGGELISKDYESLPTQNQQTTPNNEQETQNETKTETQIQQQSSNTKNNTNNKLTTVKTGDSSNSLGLILVLLGSAGVCIFVLLGDIKKKRKMKKQ